MGIHTIEELSNNLCISKYRLLDLAFRTNKSIMYTEFSIPKKTGGIRTINAPNKELKKIQRAIGVLLLDQVKAHDEQKNDNNKVSHGYMKGKSIFTNSEIHRNKKYVINVDIKDFFPSIHFGRIKGYLEKNYKFKLPSAVAKVIASISCLDGRLPQGSPLSPMLSNFICEHLDFLVMKVAKEYKVHYTRYADDLTFSTNDNKILGSYDDFISEVTASISKAGFEVNEAKTRLQYRGKRQTVTGLTVNRKINPCIEFIKQTRAMAHSMYKNGKCFLDNEEVSMNTLHGRFAFINQADVYNRNRLKKIDDNSPFEYKKYLKSKVEYKNKELNSREKQYRKFLFYKYFVANEKPLILCEGPTDILYLKAALKKYYKDYPELVAMEDSIFDFKIDFFNYSATNNYILDIENGGSKFQHLYKYYKKKSGKPNLFSYFCEKFDNNPKHPVIYLLDNEFLDNGSPIHQFINEHGKHIWNLPNNSINTRETYNKNKLCKDIYLNLYKVIGQNLCLMLIPREISKEISEKIANSKESDDIKKSLKIQEKSEDLKDLEIEDLIPELENISIGGKSFCKDDSNGENGTVGKARMAQHVLRNYRTIDLSGLRPLLDNLKKVVIGYNNDGFNI